MAILSTPRNVYVNITLTNMIALYWLTPSRENGLCTTPSIFGKRICRVTKDDILKDAKLMEEEAKAEARAHQVSLQEEKISSNQYNSRHSNSPTSSTSSVPSSIRNPLDNIRNNYNGNSNNYSRNSYPPRHPHYRNNVTSNSPFSYGNSPNNFRAPSSNWRPNQPVQHNKAPNQYNQINNSNYTNNKMINQKVRTPIQSNEPPSINSNISSSKFKFNPNSRSSPIREYNMSSDRNENNTQASDDSVLLEGLDEDSLFGDF